MAEPTRARDQYDSPAMAERRREVLETTRLMLSEKDDFSMRELALRSGVALATLYNSFGNRNQLVATAVMEVFEDILARPWEDPDVDFFDAIRLVRESVFDEISRVPAFARQMVAIYFDVSEKNPVRDTLHQVTIDQYAALLALLEKQGKLQKWVDSKNLAEKIAGAQYAHIARWAAGNLDDQELGRQLRDTVLIFVSAIATGDVADQANERLGKGK